ncbi:hypothetical protein [Streptomyces synnematoformans]|uniref:Uncharacterized protein n=1 Tax=Streptomyces synnematoformans TaxID=415721 RepID=A0ABN1ZKX5_9ACTN
MSGAYVLGADSGLTELREADHLLHALAGELRLPRTAYGCTHLVPGERPRIAVSLALAGATDAAAAWRWLTARGHAVAGLPGGTRHGPGGAAAAAACAAAEHASRSVGRAVLYPGADALTGTMTVGELLAASAIEQIVLLGAPGGPPGEARMVTRGHVRPQWLDGRLVLAVIPAAAETLIPFEAPAPTPCCTGR